MLIILYPLGYVYFLCTRGSFYLPIKLLLHKKKNCFMKVIRTHSALFNAFVDLLNASCALTLGTAKFSGLRDTYVMLQIELQ